MRLRNICIDRLYSIFFMCLIFIANGALAQDADLSNDPSNAKVTEIKGRLELDEIIEVKIQNLSEWAKVQGHTPWKLVPYMDGRAIHGLYPVAVDQRGGKVQFYLELTSKNVGQWANVLSPPVIERPVTFSVGLENQDPFPTEYTADKNPAILVVLDMPWAIAAAAFGLMLAIAFVWLAVRTPILKEASMSIDSIAPVRFCLAKVHLAVWFFVIFGAFIMIWLATGNYDTINSSIVVILGISAGTALGDNLIRSHQENRMSSSSGAVWTDAGAVEGNMKLHIDAPPIQNSITKLEKRFSFWKDLVSDSDGYSLYRFQMIAWTLALLVVFVSSVYYHLAMPEFRPDLLYLIGLSSGTYVANRVPEFARESRAMAEMDSRSFERNPPTRSSQEFREN